MSISVNEPYLVLDTLLVSSLLLLLLSPGELTGFLLRTVWLQREAKRPTTKGLCHRVFTIEFPAQSSRMS